ncbi:hypothetical protein CsSME_00038036 [Camellia sinensis var. sinensis]
MSGHDLSEVAHMHIRIGFAVVERELRLVEACRKRCCFYFQGKRGGTQPGQVCIFKYWHCLAEWRHSDLLAGVSPVGEPLESWYSLSFAPASPLP